MPYMLKDQFGRYLKIIEYPHNQYSVITADDVDIKPTVFADGREVLNGAGIIGMINNDRKEELSGLVGSGATITGEMLEKLQIIEVTQVEI